MTTPAVRIVEPAKTPEEENSPSITASYNISALVVAIEPQAKPAQNVKNFDRLWQFDSEDNKDIETSSYN